jgi:hypothetical protein
MNRWSQALKEHPCALLLRYEDLRSGPQRELKRIADFLGEKFTESQYDEAVEFASFENLREKERQNFFGNRRLQPRDINNPETFKVRRGKVGGYRDYFTTEQIGWIDEQVAVNLNPDFGYPVTHGTWKGEPAHPEGGKNNPS